MKKAKIWIRACVCVLIYTTFAACSRGTGNPRTDDDSRISLLKQNIPKDYKIPVHFIPKEVSAMCWVELNVFHLEESLKALAEMFGNISSNRNNISILIQKLQDVRFRIGAGLLETMIEDFKCHYKQEKWQTAYYFDYVNDFLTAASSKKEITECDSPPCPTTIATPSTESMSAGPLTSSTNVSGCVSAPDCSMRTERHSEYIPEVVQKGLLSLLLIPMAAIVCLLVWKVKRRRRGHPTEGNPEIGDLFPRAEENRPTLDEISQEKNKLNIIETI